MDTLKIPHVSDEPALSFPAANNEKGTWYEVNFGKLRRILNVLMEVAVKYVYSGRLVLLYFVLFVCVSALQLFLEEHPFLT